ncbi:MAG: hypothetical protein ABF295_07395 [Flavobacteriaceae bacterium]
MTVLTRIVWILMLLVVQAYGQKGLVFDGQLSAFGNYSPDSELDILIGARYIPKLDYAIPLDSTKTLDFQLSADMYGATSFSPFYKGEADGYIDPYRIWARYKGRQFEIRAGLQKIDFGVATLLRPLQWFNEIDPRDPLGLTDGVYAVLGRYYFLNNANIWIWGLYGNENTRGFDTVKTYKYDPEFGGRVQFPVPKGELGISYHHRTADSEGLPGTTEFEKIPENRIALDGKWDVEIGLWFEASYIHKSKDVGILTNQTLLNLGMDYTFGIGSGLHAVVEHLITSFDTDPFQFANNTNLTALHLTYPLGLFDNLSVIVYNDWTLDNMTFFMSYEHQFKKLTGYVMAYYNPDIQRGIQMNELINNFAGPGFRLMLVYNH